MKTFIMNIRYMEPVEGTTYITAASEEEAREKANKMFELRHGFEVIGVEESPETQMALDMKAEAEEAYQIADALGISFSQTPKKEDIN